MSDYYYADTVAEFQDYSEFRDYSTEWDCDPEYDYVDNNPVDLIDDIKEEDFIMDKKELVINQELYDLGFIGKKDFVVTELKDKIKVYEAEINKIFNSLKTDLEVDKKLYGGRDYAPTDLINLSNYLNTLEWHLCMCRDRLIGLSHEVNKDISEQAHK